MRQIWPNKSIRMFCGLCKSVSFCLSLWTFVQIVASQILEEFVVKLAKNYIRNLCALSVLEIVKHDLFNTAEVNPLLFNFNLYVNDLAFSFNNILFDPFVLPNGTRSNQFTILCRRVNYIVTIKTAYII